MLIDSLDNYVFDLEYCFGGFHLRPVLFLLYFETSNNWFDNATISSSDKLILSSAREKRLHMAICSDYD